MEGKGLHRRLTAAQNRCRIIEIRRFGVESEVAGCDSAGLWLAGGAKLREGEGRGLLLRLAGGGLSRTGD